MTANSKLVLGYLQSNPDSTFADVVNALKADGIALRGAFCALARTGEIIRVSGNPKRWRAV